MENLPAPEQARLRVGLVGTGYAAKLRADALVADPRSHLVAIAGSSLERTQEFCEPYAAKALDRWETLVNDPGIDLVVISTVNSVHAAIAQAALSAGKHVVVEYPLALDVAAAEALVQLAAQQQKLLHVEHIELLGGVHQALKANLEAIGQPFYARYVTASPQLPAPQKWTYRHDTFGFPLMGALSRLHRLTDAFGTVTQVSCQSHFVDGTEPYYTACLCSAQLYFANGAIADVVYSKGETIWQAERNLEVQGDRGGLFFVGDAGRLVTASGTQELDVGGRRGLFVKDTTMVLDHLLSGTPLYVTPAESLYTLKVAAAAAKSAATGETVRL
ncbi:MAG TPA: Gfo/Idh/MocA family oxidoreductase [Leptolyngbyaceae cyanobacterium M33_DOE_097]|uniref:Gfo/Idh/MocA family oxidoreductase n=1 Tax=Oscillatoriales cyanobacterium SpSt-418 TaxID=2282169 RepID=A0A7C3KGN5_9CYAN|nr:Gfo/Idh/MocA family oxidoreductase [Leptolyngbyaceae cyanobacterium M33_DOE_097]